jgi:hypothetical protein
MLFKDGFKPFSRTLHTVRYCLKVFKDEVRFVKIAKNWCAFGHAYKRKKMLIFLFGAQKVEAEQSWFTTELDLVGGPMD